MATLGSAGVFKASVGRSSSGFLVEPKTELAAPVLGLLLLAELRPGLRVEAGF